MAVTMIINGKPVAGCVGSIGRGAVVCAITGLVVSSVFSGFDRVFPNVYRAWLVGGLSGLSPGFPLIANNENPKPCAEKYTRLSLVLTTFVGNTSHIVPE